MKLKHFLAFAILGFHALIFTANADEGTATLGTPPSPPLADPTGIDKCRFISFVTPDGGGQSALRVNLVSLHHVDPPYTGGASIPFTAFEGLDVWVGPPAQYVESTANPIPFYASFTRCSPHYQDWSTIGLLHVTGSAIPPSSVFQIENVDGACEGVEDTAACQSGGANVSSQLEIRTTRYGDIDIPFNPASSTRQPNVSDLAAIAKKFRGVPGSLIKARALISSTNAFGEINSGTLTNDVGFGPIARVADGFRGGHYAEKMGKCTGPSSPPATGACTTDSECTGNNGTGPCVLYCP